MDILANKTRANLALKENKTNKQKSLYIKSKYFFPWIV